MTSAAIELSGLRKTYVHNRGIWRRDRVHTVAINGIDLTISAGELFGLLGPNGAGKTTTVKILTTLLLPTSGSAHVLGFDVARDPDRVRRRIGFVFGGERGLYTRLSGLDNLRYFADLYGVPTDTAKARIADLLQMLGLAGRERDRVERYSRGMKQRLHLARGLLHDPQVLFLDEPTIGLDPVGARDMRTLIRGLADRGKTIFLTTHYMLEADAICDRVAVINRGGIVAQGSPASLKTIVADLGVIEFEVRGIPKDALDALRGIPHVKSVVVADQELTQTVTIQCTNPADLAARLGHELEGVAYYNLRVREPTLEDAYIRLVA
jgi:ABC-2 type transport system ATP-binding protein